MCEARRVDVSGVYGLQRLSIVLYSRNNNFNQLLLLTAGLDCSAEWCLMILNLFSTRPDHPLGDAKELKRVLADLPQDAYKAADEIYGWFESLRLAEDFRLDQLFEVVSCLDEAAQQHLRRLTRDYLQSPRLSKGDERRLWTVCFNYWGEVAGLYARCVERFRRNPKDKGSEAFKGNLPLAATRLQAARSNQLKWIEFRYGAVGEDLWRGVGSPFLVAEEGGYAQKPVQLYPAATVMTSVAQQYLQILVRASSSVDALLPVEIELADRLITHFLPGFVLSRECVPGSVYWVDAAAGFPPARLAKPPATPSSSLRFFLPGTVQQALAELVHVVERGSIPADLNLGGEYPTATLLKVLRHLSVYWAPVPPQREFTRHDVKTRMAVLQGFDACLTVFAGNVARLCVERSAESWVVENVSLGGFRAGADEIGDWLKIGALLCMQPEGGENWVLGIVRRFSVGNDARVNVGIQTLSRNPKSIELHPRTSGFSSADAIPGIWLRDESGSDVIRMVLPRGSFDVRESLEFVSGDHRYLLTPVELVEADGDFEIGSYREQVLA